MQTLVKEINQEQLLVDILNSIKIEVTPEDEYNILVSCCNRNEDSYYSETERISDIARLNKYHQNLILPEHLLNLIYKFKNYNINSTKELESCRSKVKMVVKEFDTCLLHIVNSYNSSNII